MDINRLTEAAERAGEGQQTGPQGQPGGARRGRDTALPAGGAALPRGRGGRTVGRPCARRTSAAHGPSRWSGSC